MADKAARGDSHNNGASDASPPAAGADHGPHAIVAGENLNPVKTPVRYDAWRKAQPASFK
jgi:hypothetical protein